MHFISDFIHLVYPSIGDGRYKYIIILCRSRKVSTKFVKTVEFELDHEKEFEEGWHFKFGLSSLHIQLEQFSWHIYGDSQSEISLECILFRQNLYKQEILKV